MNDIIRFHVPSKLQYVEFVENFASIVSGFLEQEGQLEHYPDLRAVLNEVFINVVKHSDTAVQNEVVRFQFELDLPHFAISVYDYGPGFEADGHLPPYPKEIIGNEYTLIEVIDGTVSFIVSDPFTVRFKFLENQSQMDNKDAQMKKLADHGMGISIITKLMDSVSYAYVGQGKYDWKLVKKLA